MGILRLTRSFRGHYHIGTITNSPLICNSHIQTRVLSSHGDGINGKDSILPVLIVGAGPVGLVLSVLLTKLGVKCAVLEKNIAFSSHPQAHFINNRSMEIFRKLNGLADEILRCQPPVDLWRNFIYCTTLAGPILGSVDHMQPRDFEHVTSPVRVAHYPQYRLLKLLIEQLKPEILMGHECTAINLTKDGVNLSARIESEGKVVTKDFKCRYVVATDGAGSTVRKLMGIGMSGEHDLQKLVNVHFISRELGEYLMEERPGMLYFVFNTEGVGVVVAHDLREGEFVLQVPIYPPQHNFEDFGPDICEKLIFKLVGREISDINVVGIRPWVMHAEVADAFLCGDNRIILAGDAAHRFPPSGGFGMNTGIQDAHNLAWKLASLFEGIAQPSILSTYETERRQIAMFNTALSVENFKAVMAVSAALGLDPSIANSVHRAVNNVLGPVLPSGIQRAVLDGIFSIGRMQMSNAVLNENNPLGSLRLAKLKRIFDEGKSLQLQFPAEDLGFRYTKGALLPDDDSSSSTQESPTGRRRDYVPSSIPGSRLPHMMIRLLSPLSTKDALSTLDLVSVDKIEFLLIIAPIGESYRVARSAFWVAEEFKVGLKVCVMWQKDGATDGVGRTKTELSPWNNFVDVIEARSRNPSWRSWWDLCGMTVKGAVLVRPDEHIAWRAKSCEIDDPLLVLKRVFCAILGCT